MSTIYRVIYNPDSEGWGAYSESTSIERLEKIIANNIADYEVKKTIVLEVIPELQQQSSYTIFKQAKRLKLDISVTAKIRK